MRKVKKKHPLKMEIYKKGYTISSFADVCGLSRFTLNEILNRDRYNARGDTIKIISDHIGLPYEKVEVMCNG